MKNLYKLMEPDKASEISQLVGKERKDPTKPGVGLVEIEHMGMSTGPTNNGMVDRNITAKTDVKYFLLTKLWEDIVDYYNSTQPGYLSKRYKIIIDDYKNHIGGYLGY